MSLREGPFGDVKVPLTWAAGVALVVAAVAALALLLSDRRETFQSEAYGVSRQLSDTVLAPVGEVLSAPLRWGAAGVNEVRGYFFAISENRRLREELSAMREWRDLAVALRDTNERYRTLLGLRTDPPIPMVAARVVTDARGPFARTQLANAGRERGVQIGNPVMSEHGLVGRVIGVTRGASRVLLLTDSASRIPVMIDRTNARAVLTGDGGGNPRLEYLRGQEPVREGDRVLTSGDGGLFPRGLPVGVAVKGLDGRWRVALASDAAPIDYVRILQFEDFAQLVNLEELNRLHPPPGRLDGAPAGAAPAAGGQPASPSPAQGAIAVTATAPATTPRPVQTAPTAPRSTQATPTSPRPQPSPALAATPSTPPAPAAPAEAPAVQEEGQ